MGFLKHLLGGKGRGGHHSRRHNRKHDYENRDDYSDSRVKIRCPKCDEKNEVSAAFCQKCGSALGKGKCDNCGKDIPMDAKFCPNCGIKV